MPKSVVRYQLDSSIWKPVFPNLVLPNKLADSRDRVKYLYWPLVQYNNVRQKDRIGRKGAMLPDGGAMFPDCYIT